MTWRI